MATNEPATPFLTCIGVVVLATALGWGVPQRSVWGSPPNHESSQSFAQSFAQPIGTAHGLTAWQTRKALQAHLTVQFGDKIYLQCTMLFDTPVGKARLELTDGTLLIFDGKEAWVSPADAAVESARFDLLTWPYFLAAPMKLRDPGTQLLELGPLPLQGRPTLAAKLSFDKGVGDSPDDWYVLYRDAHSHRLAAMAYIVTYGGKDVQEAEKEPHAITYEGYQTVDGVLISTRWKFWLWDANQGIHGQPLGRANLSQVQFVDPSPDMFHRPADARLAPLPGQ